MSFPQFFSAFGIVAGTENSLAVLESEPKPLLFKLGFSSVKSGSQSFPFEYLLLKNSLQTQVCK